MKIILRKSVLLFLVVICIIAVAGSFMKAEEPAKEAVEIVSEKTLIPGGHSIGIKMDVKGVLVVGLEEIETKDDIVSPGYDAGLQIGDVITSINDREVYYAYEVTDILNKSDGKLNLEVLRNGVTHNYTVNAAKDHLTGDFKLGIWVKEKIAGIGTLSFYDPEENVFVALGHGIYERKTSALVEAAGGEMLKTEVKSIKEGETGEPGEIRGIFCQQDKPLGSVIKNSEYGIYATGLNVDQLELGEPMAIGTQDQVKTGKAYILTTIDGSTVEKFEVEIIKINKQEQVDSKGIEIEVTDEKLLSYCGGIVQGMSGSPIIQDGRIVGAVTHVLVNDPTRGYGIFIEHMIN